MKINPIEKQKLERQYGVWEIRGSNPFTDPGCEVNSEEDEYLILNGPSIKQISFYTIFFCESPVPLATTGTRIMNQSAYFGLLIK